MEDEKFKAIIKSERSKVILPYDLIISEFEKLPKDLKNPDYIMNNVSELILKLRENSWESYKPIEEKLNVAVLQKLVIEDDNQEIIESASGIDSVLKFIELYNKDMYILNLSNTNSRRSRAGKEFEAIIEILLMAVGLSMDSQGNIGKKEFVDKGLGKMVDVVTPTATHFTINKYDTVLISAKTTLRERWQEVAEENNRTSASSMYLATVDTTVTNDVIRRLNEAGVRLVVPKEFKEEFYSNQPSVVTFEYLFKSILENEAKWDGYEYSQVAINEIVDRFKVQNEKHKQFKFVNSYYKLEIDKYERR